MIAYSSLEEINWQISIFLVGKANLKGKIVRNYQIPNKMSE